MTKHSLIATYRKKLDEAMNLTSRNRRFRTINHMVATYEQTRERLAYFYPKRQLQMTEYIHNLHFYCTHTATELENSW